METVTYKEVTDDEGPAFFIRKIGQNCHKKIFSKGAAIGQLHQDLLNPLACLVILKDAAECSLCSCESAV